MKLTGYTCAFATAILAFAQAGCNLQIRGSAVAPTAPVLSSASVTNGPYAFTRSYAISYGPISGSYDRYCILENDTMLSHCTFVTGQLPSSFTVSAGENAKVLSIWLKNASDLVSSPITTNSVTLHTTPGAPDHLQIAAGGPQSQYAGLDFAVPLKVQIVDRYGLAVPTSQNLKFVVDYGDIALKNSSAQSTDPNGYAQVSVSSGYSSTSARVTVLSAGAAFPDLAGSGKAQVQFMLSSVTSGNGTMAAKTDLPVANSGTPVTPQGLVTADFDGDGKLDFAVNAGTAITKIYLGNGAGGFAAPVDYATNGSGVGSLGAAVGDFNRDGKIDLVTTNYAPSGTFSYLQGNGDGTLQAYTSYSTISKPMGIYSADYNLDGKLDVLIVGFSANSVAVHIGNGDGTFQAAITTPVGTHPDIAAIADFNRDGIPDFVVNLETPMQVAVFIGNGDGTFTAKTPITISYVPEHPEAGDFNGDGILDIACASDGGNYISLMLGVGDGTFGATTYIDVGGGSRALKLGDFNGDGKLDIAVVNYGTNMLGILLGRGDGTFATHVDYPVGTNPQYFMSVGDFNGDHKMDLLVPNNGSQTISLLLGN
jgi:hypothetical protein